jgi:hypothetical protein
VAEVDTVKAAEEEQAKKQAEKNIAKRALRKPHRCKRKNLN